MVLIKAQEENVTNDGILAWVYSLKVVNTTDPT